MQLLFFGIFLILLFGTCYPKENLPFVVEDGPYGGNGGGLIYTYLLNYFNIHVDLSVLTVLPVVRAMHNEGPMSAILVDGVPVADFFSLWTKLMGSLTN